jgi:hypothetical protein
VTSISVITRKQFTDIAVCNHWVHLACTALNKHDYTLLSVDDSHYYCPRCVVEIFPFNYVDETAEFLNILHIFVNDFPIFSRFMPNLHQFSILNNKKIINKDEIDPDTNVFNSLDVANKYYLPDEIAAAIKSMPVDDKFSILHINAHSLLHKLDKLELLIQSSYLDLDIVAVSETWESKLTSDLLNIPGFIKISNYRDDERKGGGVALYVNQSITFTKKRNNK